MTTPAPSSSPLPVAAPPVPVPSSSVRLPAGACDAHIHMLASPHPSLSPMRVEDPAPGSLEDYVALYRAHMEALGVSRVVIVHSILHGVDNTVTLAAARMLGADVACTVCLAPDGVSDDELDALAGAGAVALRLNYVHGGVLTLDGARRLSPRLADRGMHLQMLVHADQHMEELEDTLARMPVPVVIDHLGWPTDLDAGVEEPGFQRLLRLLGEGRVSVKLSGVYRLCGAPYLETDPFVAALARANPDGCLWGSDWPHVMLADAARPQAGKLLDAFARAVPDEDVRRRILVDAPERLFGFGR